MKNVTVIIFLLCFMITQVSGQGEIDAQKKIFYRNEKSGAVLLNSNGFGLSYRYGKWIDDRNKNLYEIEFNYVKHPKEIKFPYYSYYTTNSYVYGKMNTMFTLRGGPGHQYEMYQKADKGGISIRTIVNGGLTLALYKPIYYDIYVWDNSTNPPSATRESKKFTVDMQPSDIIGRASFFKGMKEIKVLPGLYGKAGVSFEYSTIDQVIHALELGVTLEVFPKDIPIMYSQNKFYFFAFFISYRFGKIINPLMSKPDDQDLQTK